MTGNPSLSGWGGYPHYPTQGLSPCSLDAFEFSQHSVIARGQGRSYGDAALSCTGQVIFTKKCNHFLKFDTRTGQLTAEAGITLADILHTFVPRGWFPSVVPGTQYVSLGGLIAADCHGKNHFNAGSFGQCVSRLQLLTPTGSYQCSAQENAPLFHATLGGMGLTGLITQATCQLLPIETPYLQVQQQTTKNLEHSLQQLETQSQTATYTAVWLDCLTHAPHLGRGIVLCAEHCTASDLPRSRQALKKATAVTIPWTPPFNLLNTSLMTAFNACYYRFNSMKSSFISHYQPFFFPLDKVLHWNRLYGKQGFIQYQCVVPEKAALKVFQTLLHTLQKQRFAVCLAVLKRLSSCTTGLLSFPIAGYTLSLDIPYSPGLVECLHTLDELIIQHKGRIYLAKDAHMKPAPFTAMYPALKQWLFIKEQRDPQHLFQSALSQRLEITHDRN